VRGEIALADVRLDLDDPPDPRFGAGWPLADEAGADQGAGRIKGVAGQDVARERPSSPDG
jgi:hypothetical protein